MLNNNSLRPKNKLKRSKIVNKDFIEGFVKDGRILKKDFKKIYDHLDEPFFISFPNRVFKDGDYEFYKSKRNLKNDIKEFSPLSGFEPHYDPNKWNLNPVYKLKNNCYSFALNKPSHKRSGKVSLVIHHE